MENRIIIRIVAITVVIPIISYLIKSNRQQNGNKELKFIKEENDIVLSLDADKKENNVTLSTPESSLVDSYNHPNYYTSWTGFFSLFFSWILIGLVLPYFLLYMVLNLAIMSIITSIILNVIFIFLLRNSLKINKNKVVLKIFTDKLSFSVGLEQLLFEIPFDKILNLRIVVEKGGPVWPDEYVILQVDSEYKKSVIDPVLAETKSVEFSQLMKIRYSNETLVLKGVNKTSFKEQLFKFKFGKEV